MHQTADAGVDQPRHVPRAPRRYELTALAAAAALGRSVFDGRVGPLRGFAAAPGALERSGRIGENRAPAIPSLRGKEPSSTLAGEPEFAAVFNDAMTCLSRLSVLAVVAGYSFDSYPQSST